jgi:hypothetical protein
MGLFHKNIGKGKKSAGDHQIDSGLHDPDGRGVEKVTHDDLITAKEAIQDDKNTGQKAEPVANLIEKINLLRLSHVCLSADACP